MTPQDLRAHKQAAKTLAKIPSFKEIKRGALPPPLNRIKSKRIQATEMLDVGGNYVAVFFWRNGLILSDRAFYGHLFLKIATERLYPVFEFHWHPSHKGFHCKVPCRTEQDYTDRMLPSAPELAIKTKPTLDPSIEADRNALIEVFCNAAGIALPTNDPGSLRLFS